jgi:hypothetical protein
MMGLATALALLLLTLGSAGAETVCVKYRSCLDLAPFDCTNTQQSSFVRRVCYDANNSYMLIQLNAVLVPLLWNRQRHRVQSTKRPLGWALLRSGYQGPLRLPPDATASVLKRRQPGGGGCGNAKSKFRGLEQYRDGDVRRLAIKGTVKQVRENQWSTTVPFKFSRT